LTVDAAMSPDGGTVWVLGLDRGDAGPTLYAVSASGLTVGWSLVLDPIGGNSDEPGGLAVSPDGKTVFMSALTGAGR
jgi:hypothetical protein